MPSIDRRKLLHAGIALAVPLGGMSLLSGCEQSANMTNNDDSSKADAPIEPVKKPEPNEKEGKEKIMQLRYLEIVTPEAEALCKQYSAVHGVTFSEPIANFGNARTAKLSDGGQIGIRAPLRETETPVIRPYVLVEDIEAAVATAAEAGAEIALPKMELPGHGTIAIVIQGGIECGFWQA